MGMGDENGRIGDGNGIEMKKCKHLLIINLECFK